MAFVFIFIFEPPLYIVYYSNEKAQNILNLWPVYYNKEMLMARKKHILALITIIFFVSFLLFFQIIQHDTALAEKGSTKVYLGGNPIGVVARADGVVVTDYVDVMTESGVRCPAKEAG